MMIDQILMSGRDNECLLVMVKINLTIDFIIQFRLGLSEVVMQCLLRRRPLNFFEKAQKMLPDPMVIQQT